MRHLSEVVKNTPFAHISLVCSRRQHFMISARLPVAKLSEGSAADGPLKPETAPIERPGDFTASKSTPPPLHFFLYQTNCLNFHLGLTLSVFRDTRVAGETCPSFEATQRETRTNTPTKTSRCYCTQRYADRQLAIENAGCEIQPTMHVRMTVRFTFLRPTCAKRRKGQYNLWRLNRKENSNWRKKNVRKWKR